MNLHFITLAAVTKHQEHFVNIFLLEHLRSAGEAFQPFPMCVSSPNPPGDLPAMYRLQTSQDSVPTLLPVRKSLRRPAPCFPAMCVRPSRCSRNLPAFYQQRNHSWDLPLASQPGVRPSRCSRDFQPSTSKEITHGTCPLLSSHV